MRSRPGETEFFARRFAAGDLYLRPPRVLVATAVAGCDPGGPGLPSRTWQRADWLSRLSVASKQDFARLQGFRFLFTHVKARPRRWSSARGIAYSNLENMAGYAVTEL